jgi:hypothetical protein
MTDWFDWFRLIFIVGGAIPAIIFPIYYHFTASWWSSEMGRQLMLSGVTIGALYAASLVSQFVTNEGAKDGIRAFLILLAFVSSWRQLLMYRKFKRAMIRREDTRA